MKPIQFKESTAVLTKPENMTDEQCGPLQVHRTGERIISCWKMSLVERIRAVLFGKIWIHIHTKKTHPAISLECKKTIFEKKRG